jgi:hypothetical protein
MFQPWTGSSSEDFLSIDAKNPIKANLRLE